MNNESAGGLEAGLVGGCAGTAVEGQEGRDCRGGEWQWPKHRWFLKLYLWVSSNVQPWQMGRVERCSGSSCSQIGVTCFSVAVHSCFHPSPDCNKCCSFSSHLASSSLGGSSVTNNLLEPEEVQDVEGSMCLMVLLDTV